MYNILSYGYLNKKKNEYVSDVMQANMKRLFSNFSLHYEQIKTVNLFINNLVALKYIVKIQPNYITKKHCSFPFTKVQPVEVVVVVEQVLPQEPYSLLCLLGRI